MCPTLKKNDIVIASKRISLKRRAIVLFRFLANFAFLILERNPSLNTLQIKRVVAVEKDWISCPALGLVKLLVENFSFNLRNLLFPLDSWWDGLTRGRSEFREKVQRQQVLGKIIRMHRTNCFYFWLEFRKFNWGKGRVHCFPLQ